MEDPGPEQGCGLPRSRTGCRLSAVGCRGLLTLALALTLALVAIVTASSIDREYSRAAIVAIEEAIVSFLAPSFSLPINPHAPSAAIAAAGPPPNVLT